MIEERSAGVVIFLENEQGISYLLLNYPSGHWDFAKGRIEDGESLHEAAIRETREETGITDLEFLKDFEERIEYHFQFEGKLIHKQVVFFLAKTKTRDVKVSQEHTNFIWLDFENAIKKITYENAKNILSKANKLLVKS